MAEASEKKSGAQTAVEAAGSIKQAAKLAADVGRVFAGDMSAIKDVLMNKLFWEIILVAALLISLVGMLIGAAVTGVIQFLATSWAENWEENMLDQAIGSNGNATMYKNFGWLFAFDATVNDVVKDAFKAITKAGIDAGKGTSDNGQLSEKDKTEAGARNPNENDYETTMQAIHSNVMLSQALTDRLDMIKGRVKQRGVQLKNAAIKQYITGRKSEYYKIAKELSKKIEEKVETNADEHIVLYAGFNEDLSEQNFNFDMRAFDLTDLQALKILAIFSIQHDCQLTEMDMWTLMDYCGWFTENGLGKLEDTADSIYDIIPQDQRYGSDIGDVADTGTTVTSLEFDPLNVPTWTGTCAPQWYYEELAKIREHNRLYLDYLYQGNIPEGMIPLGINAPTPTSETYTIPGSEIPAGYTGTGPLGSPNKFFYVIGVHNKTRSLNEEIKEPEAGQNLVITHLWPGCQYEFTLTLFRARIKNDGSLGERFRVSSITLGTYYVPANLTAEEADTLVDTSQFSYLSTVQPYGLVDRIYYSTENNMTIKREDYTKAEDWTREEIKAELDGCDNERSVLKFWDKYVWAQEKTTLKGVVRRSDDGKHSFEYTDSVPSPTYAVVSRDKYGNTTKYRYTTYEIDLYKGSSYVGSIRRSSYDKFFRNLSGDTSYSLYLWHQHTYTHYTYTYDEEGNITSTEISYTYDYGNQWIGSFTTFPNQLNADIYQLYAEIDIAFQARSIDEIAFELLGIWPGNLNKTVQVVRTTHNNNLVGLSQDGKTYSYCLRGGNMTGIHTLNTASGEIDDDNLKALLQSDLTNCSLLRSRTVSKSDNLPITTVKWTIEYGLNASNPLTDVNQKPSVGGWCKVSTDGGRLVFNISGTGTYYVHCLITEETETLNKDGTVSKSTKKHLLTIDYIMPNGRSIHGTYVADKKVDNGPLYAAGHLGNDKLLLNWTDIYTAPNGMTQNLEFTRMTGYQYESYVDMVMALAELLGVPYKDWEPAMLRAKEMGWTIQN